MKRKLSFSVAYQQNIAVIGEGAIGVATALSLIKRNNHINLTVFYDRPFEKTVSCCPAGLFRIDSLKHRPFGKISFKNYAKIFREVPPSISGVNLISGHILSTNLTELVEQERIYGDIVYNFRYLREDEMKQFTEQKDDGHMFAIHFTTFTTEGGKFIPWMKKQLLKKGVNFIKRPITTLSELYPDFDVIINCAGLNGGILAADGDDKNMFPIRGVVFKVNATWHKHFLYKRFLTFTIPTTDSVYIGTVKQEGRYDLEITPDDRDDILGRYYELQPTIKDAEILDEWAGLRPGRIGGVRLEMTTIRYPTLKNYGLMEKIVKIVHNYGHGGHGLTLANGCGETVADLIFGNSTKII